MTPELYLLFVLASALLIATPGPNVALIVSTSLSQGARNGFLTMAGVNLGVTLQLSAIAMGLSWIVDPFAHHFDRCKFSLPFTGNGCGENTGILRCNLLSRPVRASEVEQAKQRASWQAFPY
ncbi:MAG: LysE family transporter [Rhodomicrobium sp.]